MSVQYDWFLINDTKSKQVCKNVGDEDIPIRKKMCMMDVSVKVAKFEETICDMAFTWYQCNHAIGKLHIPCLVNHT